MADSLKLRPLSFVPWLLCAACATQPQWREAARDPGPGTPPGTFVQGMVGATDLEVVSLETSGASIGIEEANTSTLPLLGAAMTYPLSGQRFQVGVEVGATAGWDKGSGLVRLNGTQIASSDNEIFLLDCFVGAGANFFLSERWRLYGGAGPVLQFGYVDLDYTDENGERTGLHEDGFGVGVYARGGIELLLWDFTWAGIGVRWLDSRFDPGGAFTDFDFEALQYVFTVSHRY